MPSFGRIVIFIGTGLLLLIGVAAVWAIWHVTSDYAFGTRLIIYADGAREPIAAFRRGAYEAHQERGLSDYPPLLIDAVLLMEDRRFYQHRGVDLRGIMRAAWANATSGAIVQGGSTLTQQLARIRYLNRERTYWRKIREGILALFLETTLRKDEILEAYLNEVYLGHVGPLEVRGIGAASRIYMGKEPSGLSAGQAALLVGLIRTPNTTSPLISSARARERRDLVLRQLRREGKLSQADYFRALQEPVQVIHNPTVEAAHFLDLVRKEVEGKVSGLARLGELSVFTTLDLATQQAAQQSAARELSKLDGRQTGRREDRVEGALVALDVGTGAIKAMVGGRNYKRSQFNRAVQARRQPGSLFKPFVYLAAFEARRGSGRSQVLTPATVVEDGPLALAVGSEHWTPRNFNDRYQGAVRMREALERSLNTATVRVAELVGLSQVIRQARASGIESPLRSGPSTVLGASEVSLLEITAAYGTLARGGEWVKPVAVKKVVNGRGHVLFEDTRQARRAASPQAAFLVTSILQGTIERGTAASARRLGLARPAAGKTGTSNDLRDAWFVGYTPDLVAGVWVGLDSGSSLGLTGAQAALPLWTRFIEQASTGGPIRAFEPPPGIVAARIDPASGLRVSSGCPGGVDEFFIQGTEPTQSCPEIPSILVGWLRRLFSH